MNRAQRSTRSLAQTAGFRRLWMEAVESRRLLAGLIADGPVDIDGQNDWQLLDLTTPDATCQSIRLASFQDVAPNAYEALIAAFGFRPTDASDELDFSPIPAAVPESDDSFVLDDDLLDDQTRDDQTRDGDPLGDDPLDDHDSVFVSDCGEHFEFLVENGTLSVLVPGSSNNDSHELLDVAWNFDLSAVDLPSEVFDFIQRNSTVSNDSTASPGNLLPTEQTSNQKPGVEASTNGTTSDLAGTMRPAVVVSSAIASSLTNNVRDGAGVTTGRDTLASTVEQSPSAAVVSTPGTPSYFHSATTNRRVAWSMRDESLDRATDGLTRMTVWSGSTSQVDATRGIADTGPAEWKSAAWKSPVASDTASIAVWRESTRSEPGAVRETVATDDGLAWVADSTPRTGVGVTNNGQSHGERQVERVTLGAAVDSSLATLHWARRMVVGDSAQPVVAELEQMASSDSDPSWRRSWTGFAAATFSAVQLLWQRRRKRSAEDEKLAISTEVNGKDVPPPGLPPRRENSLRRQ